MVDIVFVLDESSSMSRYSEAYIKSINKFITSQKQFNPTAKFTMVKFSNSVSTVCLDRPMYTLSEFTEEHYRPEGLTCMYDAIGKVMQLKQSNSVKNVIMFILTDGHDNYSDVFDKKQISDNIEYLKNRGWCFVYIATDKNAQKICEELRIETCLKYSESDRSIDCVADACNIAVGHAMSRWSGLTNEYSNKKMPMDVSELINDIANLRI